MFHVLHHRIRQPTRSLLRRILSQTSRAIERTQCRQESFDRSLCSLAVCRGLQTSPLACAREATSGGPDLTEVPQLSQHALTFKRLCEQIQAIFSTTFWMIFGDVGSAKPRCASSWATGLSGRATRRRRSWPRFLTGRITSMERMVETSNRS